MAALPSVRAEERKHFTNSFTPFSGEAARTLRTLSPQHLTHSMEIQVPLRMRKFEQLQERLGRGELVPRAELERDYLPLEADYQAVAKWLTAEGFTITGTDSHRLSIFAHGSVAQIQKSLQVTMGEVTVDGQDYHTAQNHPSLPKQFESSVLAVNGLQPYLRAKKHQAIPASLTNHSAPFVPSEMLSFYNANGLSVTGSGQKIAILIDRFAASSDLTTFWSNCGIPQTLSHVETINVNSLTLPAPGGEETLDEEWTTGIASGAGIRVYAAGSTAWSNLDHCLQQIITDLPTQPQMHQLSISLGLGEAYLATGIMSTDSQYFATIASYGVSVFVSTGDGGSNPLSSGSAGAASPTVEYYSSDPSVTGVGGTSLIINAVTGGVYSETVWNRISEGGGATGGGISSYFARPSWQNNTGISGTTRLVPDVALEADPNSGAYVILNGAAWQYGGTSLSAPVWAGFCALINQARAQASLSPMGVLNPRIYPLLGSANFRDITSGSNGVYAAGAGYDLSTGLGVPVISSLIQTLLLPAVNSFTPATGPAFTTVTINGFNFANVSSVTFNGMPASFLVNSENQITATVPYGAGTGPIVVTTAIGSGTSTSTYTMTALNSPAVTSYNPARGPAGTSVVLTGSSFIGISAVTFNGVSASYIVNNSNQITATAPSGVTTGPIVVTNPTGSGTGPGMFYATAGSVSSTIYSTGFETAEGYPNSTKSTPSNNSTSLSGTKGWAKSDTGGTGLLSSFFSGQGQAAYVGYVAPTGTSTSVWQPINYTPAPAEIITFSVQMQVKDSFQNVNRDMLRWSLRNTSGARLFSIDFNNSTKALTYTLDDNVARANLAGSTFTNSNANTLTVTLDFAHNWWTATLSGTTLALSQQITTTGAALNLGDIDAVWSMITTKAGNDYLVFDNYSITTSAPTYSIGVTASPANTGTVSGGGTYTSGSNIILTASPLTGYAFNNWTENGTVVSTSANYALSATSNRTLVANFLPGFSIAASASPSNGGTVSGAGSYVTGRSVTLTAAPSANFVFVNWTENGTPVSTSASYTFIPSSDRTLVANFTPLYTIATSASPGSGGTVTGAGSYLSGASVTVTATPNANYVFVNWTVGGTPVSTSPSYTFTATANQTFVANFAPLYTIATSASPVNGGTTAGAGIYVSGSSVTVTATPSANYTFVNWTESGTTVSTSANYTFTASANRTLVANFTPTYLISTSASPVSGGTTAGAGTYVSGSSVTVTATPSANYAFVNWTESGTTVSTSASYTFTASTNRTLVANFTPTYLISTSASPVSAGTTTGGGTYVSGSSVTVIATPNANYVFVAWTVSGTAVSTAASYTFTASVNRTLVANFSPTYIISTSASPVSGGTTTGAGTYVSGSSVTVTATPSANYAFVNWTENGTSVSTSTNYTFTAGANRTLIANFTPTYLISTSASPVSGGTTTGAGTYVSGSSVTVTAIPNANYVFVNWTENGTPVSASASYTFTAGVNRTLIANFTPTYLISTSASPVSGGTTTGAGTYVSGSSVTVTSIPNANYVFVNWTENGTPVSASATYTFTANANRSLIANFVELFAITTSASPVSGGTATGAGIYVSGSSVTVVATPAPNYAFVDWLEGGNPVSASASYTFTASANRTLVAEFAPSCTVTVSGTPAIGGTTSGGGSSPAGATVTVTATSAAGNAFVNWLEDGAPVSGSSSFVFSATTNRTLVAEFLPTYTIDTSASPTTGGTTAGGGVFVSGSSVTVTATAAAGYAFTSWTLDGGLVSSVTCYVLTATTNQSLVANFAPTYTIATAAAPLIAGTTSGDGIYATGSSVTVSAFPASGYGFVNWTENGAPVSSSSNYIFNAGANRILTANFAVLFSSWSASAFTESELTEPTVSGPLADPTHSGIPNLLCYAFGMDPKQPEASALPQSAIENGCLTISFNVNPLASDLTYVVEVSSDLIHWDSGPGATSTPVPVAGTQRVKVSDLVPVSSSGRRMIRVRVVGK